MVCCVHARWRIIMQSIFYFPHGTWSFWMAMPYIGEYHKCWIDNNKIIFRQIRDYGWPMNIIAIDIIEHRVSSSSPEYLNRSNYAKRCYERDKTMDIFDGLDHYQIQLFRVVTIDIMCIAKQVCIFSGGVCENQFWKCKERLTTKRTAAFLQAIAKPFWCAPKIRFHLTLPPNTNINDHGLSILHTFEFCDKKPLCTKCIRRTPDLQNNFFGKVWMKINCTRRVTGGDWCQLVFFFSFAHKLEESFIFSMTQIAA